MLASINRIETAFGTNLNVSSAGALGWMQFIPSSWEAYGTDANGDGRKDPYNPVDAICAAARYLKAAGGEEDLYTAIFAYNHADWYVDEVLLYAKQYGNLPSGLVDSLTGLTEGAHFPVAAKARYADDISERAALKRATPKQGVAGNAADVISDSPTRRGIDIFAEEDAPVVAANDGVITKIGKSKQLGKYIVLRDAYGNEYTYAGLGAVSDVIPVPKRAQAELEGLPPGHAGRGRREAQGRGEQDERRRDDHARAEGKGSARRRRQGGRVGQAPPTPRRRAARSTPRTCASASTRCRSAPSNIDRADLTGQLDSMLGKGDARIRDLQVLLLRRAPLDDKNTDTRPLREGSHVVGGTVIGRVGGSDGRRRPPPQLLDLARRPGLADDRPEADPRRLEAARGHRHLPGRREEPVRPTAPRVGQVLLASKSQLQRQVLSNPMIELYSCGRRTSRPVRSTAA